MRSRPLTTNRTGQQSFTTAGRTRFHSMRSNASRSKRFGPYQARITAGLSACRNRHVSNYASAGRVSTCPSVSGFIYYVCDEVPRSAGWLHHGLVLLARRSARRYPGDNGCRDSLAALVSRDTPVGSHALSRPFSLLLLLSTRAAVL